MKSPFLLKLGMIIFLVIVLLIVYKEEKYSSKPKPVTPSAQSSSSSAQGSNHTQVVQSKVIGPWRDSSGMMPMDIKFNSDGTGTFTNLTLKWEPEGTGARGYLRNIDYDASDQDKEVPFTAQVTSRGNLELTLERIPRGWNMITNPMYFEPM